MGDWPKTNIIGDQLLGGSQASFDFPSIPGSYVWLRLLAFIREDDAVGATNAKLRFNGDTGVHYDTMTVRGFGATVGAVETLATTSGSLNSCSLGASAGAGLYSMIVVDVYDYTDSGNEKVFVFQGNSKSGTASGNFIQVSGSGWWRQNSAITQITLLPNSGNWVVNSRATLFGMA